MTGRSMAVGKSPLTGGWGDSNAGGRFGPKLLEAGLDAIFVTGVARSLSTYSLIMVTYTSRAPQTYGVRPRGRPRMS